jgi:hypothetical protein
LTTKEFKTMALNNGEDVGALFDRGSFGLTPDQASAELARMTAEFNSAPPPVPDPVPTPADRTKAAEARLKLEALKSDPEFGRRYLNGDVATKQHSMSLRQPLPPAATMRTWHCLVFIRTAILTAVAAPPCVTKLLRLARSARPAFQTM